MESFGVNLLDLLRPKKGTTKHNDLGFCLCWSYSSCRGLVHVFPVDAVLAAFFVLGNGVEYYVVLNAVPRDCSR